MAHAVPVRMVRWRQSGLDLRFSVRAGFQGEAAVDEENDAGDERGFVRGEEEGRVGDILSGALVAHGNEAHALGGDVVASGAG